MIDRDTAALTRAGGCPIPGCKGALHVANFRRKPRGIPAGVTVPEGFEVRFDLCCGLCRKRVLPRSVRFLGRKVYLGVANAVATAAWWGLDQAARRLLRQELGASLSTVLRWCAWWRELPETEFWARLRGSLPVSLDILTLPGALLGWFKGEREAQLLGLLKLLGPLTGSIPIPKAEVF